MREILFRGQHRRKGEKVRMGDGEPLPSVWVYGGVLQGPGDFSIVYGGKNPYNISEGLNKWPVYTDTLGQYTGLKDKNGKRIFEGDVVKEVYGEKVYNKTFVVSMDSDRRGWFPFACGDGCGCCETDVWTPDHALVIGNVHDNPELVKGDEP